MTDVFICDGIRTPVGRYGGGLAAVRTDDLAAIPVNALMERHHLTVVWRNWVKGRSERKPDPTTPAVVLTTRLLGVVLSTATLPLEPKTSNRWS